MVGFVMGFFPVFLEVDLHGWVASFLLVVWVVWKEELVYGYQFCWLRGVLFIGSQYRCFEGMMDYLLS